MARGFIPQVVSDTGFRPEVPFVKTGPTQVYSPVTLSVAMPPRTLEFLRSWNTPAAITFRNKAILLTIREISKTLNPQKSYNIQDIYPLQCRLSSSHKTSTVSTVSVDSRHCSAPQNNIGTTLNEYMGSAPSTNSIKVDNNPFLNNRGDSRCRIYKKPCLHFLWHFPARWAHLPYRYWRLSFTVVVRLESFNMREALLFLTYKRSWKHDN